VVYMTKSSGPRTEPWGTPQEDVCQEDRSVSHLSFPIRRSAACIRRQIDSMVQSSARGDDAR